MDNTSGSCFRHWLWLGILAIGACKLGAGPVVAVDNDPVAVAEARENLAHNGISKHNA